MDIFERTLKQRMIDEFLKYEATFTHKMNYPQSLEVMNIEGTLNSRHLVGRMSGLKTLSQNPQKSPSSRKVSNRS